MTDAAEFIDAALQAESSWQRQFEDPPGMPTGISHYGTSIGAVRGTVRDALKRYRELGHDELTALGSELWRAPVFERRLAAVVLLQSVLPVLRGTDLTRIEGFLRSAEWSALVDPLATDVIGPLVASLRGIEWARAEAVVDRWARETDPWLRRAAVLSPLRAIRAGAADPDRVARNSAAALAIDESPIVADAVAAVAAELAEPQR